MATTAKVQARTDAGPETSVTLGLVARTWTPLVGSWLLVMVELPLVSIMLGRLATPEVSLAAYGGVVFPLVMIAAAPVIMLLTASTALARDHAGYARVRAFAALAGLGLAAAHALVVCTPLYGLLLARLIPAPAPVLEAARLGLIVMTPYAALVAWRRMNGGVLIRLGAAATVGTGTMLRLAVTSTVLAAGLALEAHASVAVAGLGVIVGLVTEASYLSRRARSLVRRCLAPPASGHPTVPLEWRKFLGFYAPLATTAILSLLIQPLSSAALARLPLAMESLAVWAVVYGLVSVFCAPGFSYQEVVVALAGRPQGLATLRRFTGLIVLGTTLTLALVAATPLGALWFSGLWGLSASLASLAASALWTGLPIPALVALQSWWQGRLVHAKRTRAVTEGILAYFGVSTAVLAYGVAAQLGAGVHLTLSALAAGLLARDAWLWYRCRGVPTE